MEMDGRKWMNSGYAADMLQLIWATALHCIRMVRVIVYCIVGTYTVAFCPLFQQAFGGLLG